ncbi:hypothetical protein M2284_002916 [Rhodococcus sp. LBL1]|nr:hypothetical protein [Rhodococcus sp. LBL1]MDH6684419.1 hypothetical protein [Rhodococcus sp. LBL2]
MAKFLFLLTGPALSDLHRDELRAYAQLMFRAGTLLADDTLAVPENGFSLAFGCAPVVLAPSSRALTSYWIAEVSDQYEAREWARRAPLAAGERLDALRIHREGEEELSRTPRLPDDTD